MAYEDWNRQFIKSVRFKNYSYRDKVKKDKTKLQVFYDYPRLQRKNHQSIKISSGRKTDCILSAAQHESPAKRSVSFWQGYCTFAVA